MTKSFIISTDSCVDHLKTYLNNNDVYCIILKRLTGGVETEDLYDSTGEFEKFYADLKTGALPTTSQLSEFEMSEHFKKILEVEPEGDIIHVPLSSGLSGTCDNAVRAANELNKELIGRSIRVVDSLSASLGIAMLVDRLIELRNAGVQSEEAVRIIEDLRDRQQVWVIQNSLFHLKRGGRISGIKAAIGTLLSVKPIIIINNKGKLVIENTIKGKSKAISYVLQKMHEFGVDSTETVGFLLHSSAGEFFAEFENAVRAEFKNFKFKKGMVGPIIGTHLGEGSVVVVFEGAGRLEI